jgi:hypothetical protein
LHGVAGPPCVSCTIRWRGDACARSPPVAASAAGAQPFACEQGVWGARARRPTPQPKPQAARPQQQQLGQPRDAQNIEALHAWTQDEEPNAAPFAYVAASASATATIAAGADADAAAATAAAPPWQLHVVTPMTQWPNANYEQADWTARTARQCFEESASYVAQMASLAWRAGWMGGRGAEQMLHIRAQSEMQHQYGYNSSGSRRPGIENDGRGGGERSGGIILQRRAPSTTRLQRRRDDRERSEARRHDDQHHDADDRGPGGERRRRRPPDVDAGDL